MRTGNPALNAEVFTNVHRTSGSHMTLEGAVNKSFILLALLVATSVFTWNVGYPYSAFLLIGGIIGGLVVAIITIFKKEWSPVTAPLYALFEGVVIGGISSLMELAFPGIVFQAVLLTMGTFFCLLMAYKSGYIKATENFRLGLFAATGAVMLIYLASFVLGFFGINIPYIHESGLIGIGFSLVVVVIAALNLVLDFDFIEQGAKNKLPSYMEWYAAFGLLVTLVWLYLEILRLLAKIRSRD